MNKMDELNKLFSEMEDASSRNQANYPYVEKQASFNKKLKKFLKEHFGHDIQFDREETFAYIQAHYKGIGIEINTHGGIIFSIENEDVTDIINDFEPIFSGIIGLSPICKYTYCSDLSEFRTSYPTVEWSLHPENRLNYLAHNWNCRVPYEYMKNFTDYYTASIIEDLGDNLLTTEGYIALFEGTNHDLTFHYYKREQVKKAKPDIEYEVLYAWIDSSRKELSIKKTVS